MAHKVQSLAEYVISQHATNKTIVIKQQILSKTSSSSSAVPTIQAAENKSFLITTPEFITNILLNVNDIDHRWLLIGCSHKMSAASA